MKEKQVDMNFDYFDKNNSVETLSEKRLKELELEPNFETLFTNFKIFFQFNNPGSGKVGTHIMSTGSGDIFNLGNGDWFIVGTGSAIQYYNGKQYPYIARWSMEYTKATDSLVWSYDDQTQKYESLSLTSSPVQLKVDISGMPKLIIVRKDYLGFGRWSIHGGSYITIP